MTQYNEIIFTYFYLRIIHSLLTFKYAEYIKNNNLQEITEKND